MALENNPRWKEFVGRIHYLPTYLKDLSALLQRNVTKENLLSLMETNVFFENVQKIHYEQIYKATFDFANKPSVVNFVHEHVTQWDVPYMIYLCDVDYCGMLEIPSLSCFNWNFQFTDEHCGLVGFIRKDAQEKILLDYYEEELDYFIDIKIECSPNR